MKLVKDILGVSVRRHLSVFHTVDVWRGDLLFHAIDSSDSNCDLDLEAVLKPSPSYDSFCRLSNTKAKDPVNLASGPTSHVVHT